MKYQFIDTNRRSYAVRALCQALEVSTSGYYAALRRPPSARSERQTVLISHIRAVHTASRDTYGAPRIHAELSAQGIACSRNTVAKLMRQAHIMPKAVRRFRVTTDSRNTKASPTCSSGYSGPPDRTRAGCPISPSFQRARAGFIWRPSWTSTHVLSWVGA